MTDIMPGERVRVVAVDPTDSCPEHTAGEICVASWITPCPYLDRGDYVLLESKDVHENRRLTYCKIERVAEPMRAEEFGSAPDAAAAAVVDVAERLACVRCGDAVKESYQPGTCDGLDCEPRIMQSHDEAEPWQDVHGTPRVPLFMSTDSATRKRMPVASGFLAYFPDAAKCVSFVSMVGNEKHNPGEPLHWAKEKSSDEPDAEVRHMLDGFQGLPPDQGLEELGELGHYASKAWRAMADLQRACDRVRAEYAAATKGSK